MRPMVHNDPGAKAKGQDYQSWPGCRIGPAGSIDQAIARRRDAVCMAPTARSRALRFSAFPGAAAHLAAARQGGEAVAAALVVGSRQPGLAEDALAAALVRAGAGVHPGDLAGLAAADLRRALRQRLAHLPVHVLRDVRAGLQAIARTDALAHDLELACNHAGPGLR